MIVLAAFVVFASLIVVGVIKVAPAVYTIALGVVIGCLAIFVAFVMWVFAVALHEACKRPRE